MNHFCLSKIPLMLQKRSTCFLCRTPLETEGQIHDRWKSARLYWKPFTPVNRTALLLTATNPAVQKGLFQGCHPFCCFSRSCCSSTFCAGEHFEPNLLSWLSLWSARWKVLLPQPQQVGCKTNPRDPGHGEVTLSCSAPAQERRQGLLHEAAEDYRAARCQALFNDSLFWSAE